MNAPLVLLLISVAAVGVGVAVRAMRDNSWVNKNDRLWVLGDSLGVGLLPRLKQIGQDKQVPVEGNPKGGTIIRQWAEKDLSAIKDWGATVVLVVLGSNDSAASQSYVEKEAPIYAKKLIDKLHAMGVKVCWLVQGETGALKHSVEIRSMVEALAFSEGIMERSVPEQIPYSIFDYIHPTPDGYQQLAAWMWSEWERS